MIINSVSIQPSFLSKPLEKISQIFQSLMEKIVYLWKKALHSFCNCGSGRVFVFETLRARKGFRDSLQKELTILVGKSLSQWGCFDYSLFQNREDLDEFAVMMCFADEKSYRAHIESDFIADFEKRLGESHYEDVEERLYTSLR